MFNDTVVIHRNLSKSERTVDIINRRNLPIEAQNTGRKVTGFQEYISGSKQEIEQFLERMNK